MSMIIDEQRFFDTLHKMFNVEIGGVDNKDMHFTRKNVFTFTMQHLLSKIKRKDLVPKARAKERLKSKETRNESIQKYDSIKQTKT
jgi:hypothetical protein